MSYTLACTADLTASSAGATIHAQLYDSAGNTSGAAITSGVVELMTGIFQLVVTVDDGFVGSLVFYESGNTDNRAAVSINPQETENADVKTSTRSSHSAANVVTAMQAVADDFKADVSTLATSSALATVGSLVDAIKAVTDLLPDGGALTTLLSNVAAILTDTGELQTDWTDGGRLDLILDATATSSALATVDTNVDSVLSAVSSGGVTISSATMNAIADALLSRSVSNVEDTASLHSMAEIILAMLESSAPSTTWTIYKTDGSTAFNTRTLTEYAGALPVVGIA